VVVAARREDRLKVLAREIAANGGEALAVPLDVTNADSVAAAFDAAGKAYGVVDILSNNAGVADSKFAVDIDEESWDWVLDTNLKGAWLVAREAGTRMIAAGKPGSIVNTASILGRLQPVAIPHRKRQSSNSPRASRSNGLVRKFV
jgi:NAD(P)-dependent dehydrogenase (short-subunit alcohol dehydrogenase family)